jgi:hypothetical protein
MNLLLVTEFNISMVPEKACFLSNYGTSILRELSEPKPFNETAHIKRAF